MKDDKNRIYDSMKAAATGMTLEMRVLKLAKAAGCLGFRGGRIYADELRAWLAEHPEVAKAKNTAWRTKIDKERHRKLKMENDVRARTLISREWMAERVHIAAGRVDGFRHKSEAEHPLLFAATNGDVAACREIVRKIWDEVMASLNSLATDFSE